jgi:hypothetical protein
MDPRPTRAETLPALYRAILDAIGELERRGLRSDAARARVAASQAYAVWDEAAERRLNRLHESLIRRASGAGDRGSSRSTRTGSNRSDGTDRSSRPDPVAGGARTG